ncbi:hypothetical protein O3G_MSEX000977 [Manduca sexta]|nr:hypothetical protein O3G_MSEX000977 [Manduca sexta]
MSKMTEENASLRRRIEELEKALCARPSEDAIEQLEARLQARLESTLMGPAQRPPLAHETKTAQVELPVQEGFVGGQPQSATTKAKGKAKGSRAAQPAPPVLTPLVTPSNNPSCVAVAGPSGVKVAKGVAKKGTQGEKGAALAPTPKNAPQKTKGRGKNKPAPPCSKPHRNLVHFRRPLCPWIRPGPKWWGGRRRPSPVHQNPQHRDSRPSAPSRSSGRRSQPR